MTRRRFYASPGSFADDCKTVRLAAEEARHLRDVLRLQRGAEVHVFDGEGKEFRCEIEDSDRDHADLKIIAEAQPAKLESPLDLILAVALLKGEKFDLVVQKATELGVSSVLPIITERADIRLRDENDASKRIMRWQRIALEAAKQSGRARVPTVGRPQNLSSLLKCDTEALRVMFSERAGQHLGESIKLSEGGGIIALVGSEGGWSDEEIEEARQSGWTIITLGGRTLRAETAAIAVVALLQNLCGDLN